FMVPAALLPARPLADGAFGERRNPGDGQRQLLTTAVLEAMVRDKPADAFAVVELTMVDLYPDPAWNFVFGQARPTDAVGIFSFARYAPDGDALTPAQGTRLLTRSCQVLAHEIGHLFGIDHCIWFHCVMNGANHLQESDLQPMHCCPVDLRKLQAATGCDVLERYRGLQALCAQWGLTEEQAWLDAEIVRLAR
ncbi:MAG: hypothetical protein H0W83_08385, partial [Planctomycetes bacterium]|nr:hypothetical protein [Planctomycetota bacterium]